MPVQQAQKKIDNRPFSRFVIIFILLTIILLVLKAWIKGGGIDYIVLLSGNTILFLATLFSFYLYNKALQNNNPHVFIRFIYGGMFLKMIICITAAMVYILIARNTVSKIALFGCFGLYSIYTFTEVKILMQLSKQRKDA